MTPYHIEREALCVTAKWRARLPTWVNHVIWNVRDTLPVYPLTPVISLMAANQRNGRAGVKVAPEQGSWQRIHQGVKSVFKAPYLALFAVDEGRLRIIVQGRFETQSGRSRARRNGTTP